jgi:hypothetical protein
LAIEHIGDLKPDRRNARKHNPRNIGMIASAMQEVGAARSIVIDEDGNILAGNGTVEAAAQVGIERVQVVDVDGETIVAVRRVGLSAEAKQRLALYDNRTAELADWDTEVIADMVAEGENLDGLFYENELALLTGDIPMPDDPREHWEGMPGIDGDPRACQAIKIYFQTPQDVQALAEVLGVKLTEKTKSIWWPEAPE